MPLVDSATARGPAPIAVYSASKFARCVAQHPAQSSTSIRRPADAVPAVWHHQSRFYAPSERDWNRLGPDAVSESAVPGLTTLASSTALSIPSPLPGRLVPVAS